MDTFNLFILQISLKYSLIISSNCVHLERKCYLQLINSYVIMNIHTLKQSENSILISITYERYREVINEYKVNKKDKIPFYHSQ